MAMFEPVPFLFEGRRLRVTTQNGEPWFVAADVCSVLGLANTATAVEKLDADEKGVGSIDTLGGPQRLTLISESGLYALVLRSRDAMTPGSTPHRFRRWVTAEVLPAIRKTGGYGEAAPDPAAVLSDPDWLRGALLTYTEKVIALESRVADMAPKVEALDRIAESHGTFNRTDAAKMLGIPPQVLIRWMRTNHWTYRRPPNTDDIAYQSKIEAGLLEHKITTGPRGDGTEWSSTSVRVTAKGMTVLARAFPPAAARVA